MHRMSPAFLLKLTVVLTPLLLLLISSSGCIQTEMFKSIFFKEEQKETVWEVEEVVNIQYRFTDTVVSTYPDQVNFLVKDQAKWFILSIEIKFHIVYASSLPDRVDIEANPDREVKLVLIDPEGKANTLVFQNTAVVNLDPVIKPMPGLWKLQVEGKGRGLAFQEYTFYDEFRVVGRLNQPVD